MKRYEKRYFEEAYKGYEEADFVKVNYDTMLNHVLRYKKHGRLLELGCAYGYFLRKAEKYFETYGIDVSEHAIKQAKRATKKTKLRVANIENDMDVFDKKFDIIIAHDVLEHLKDPYKVIKDCYSVLKKNGYFFIRVPNKSCLMLKIHNLFGKERRWFCYKDKTHISMLEIEEWTRLLLKAGFKPRILANPPTLTLRKFLKHFPSIELPSFLNILNHSVVFVCKKK